MKSGFYLSPNQGFCFAMENRQQWGPKKRDKDLSARITLSVNDWRGIENRTAVCVYLYYTVFVYTRTQNILHTRYRTI